MSRNTHPYVMTPKTLGFLEARYGNTILCYRCEEPIKTGQLVVSRRVNHSRKIYHQQCWDGMFVDVEVASPKQPNEKTKSISLVAAGKPSSATLGCGSPTSNFHRCKTHRLTYHASHDKCPLCEVEKRRD